MKKHIMVLLKSPTGAFIVPLRYTNANLGVLLRTCVRGSRPLSVRTYATIDRKHTL